VWLSARSSKTRRRLGGSVSPEALAVLDATGAVIRRSATCQRAQACTADRAHDSIERRLLAGAPAAWASGGQADLELLPLQERRRRPARPSIWLKPVPRQATHGRRVTTVGKKTATSTPLPRQGIQRVFANAGGPRAVTSSSSSSRDEPTDTRACILAPIRHPSVGSV
jgi:hypothetical protein